MSDEYAESPEMTQEQIEKGCRIEDGKVVCPDKGQGIIDKDGTTSIRLGEQKITAMNCRENKKTGELDCTVRSKAKQ